MQQGADLTGGATAFNVLAAGEQNGGVNREIRLLKYASGMDSSPTVLFAHTLPSFSFDATFSMEIEWSVIGGTSLNSIVRLGTATDYSDLAEEFNATDGSPVGTTSSGEGLAAKQESASTHQYYGWIDEVQIFG